MREFIDSARSVNCNLLLNVHTRTTTEEKREGRNRRVWRWVDARLEGSIRDLLPGWAVVILYLVDDPIQDKKLVLTQDTRIRQKIYMARDRYHIFEGQQLALYKERQRGSEPGDREEAAVDYRRRAAHPGGRAL
jgi:hypothetical protein